MATYEMRLVIETDSDFSLNGKGANDKPYRVTLPTKKGETLRECYKRWLSTVKIGGHKKEAAKKWLSSVEVTTVVVFEEATGNWNIKGYLFVQDLPETKHTCYECGLLVCGVEK